MAAMMALPWALIGASDTSYWYAIIWDILLSLHLISLLIPKRFAVTRTHLFADGQRYDWKKLRLNAVNLHVALCFFEKGGGFLVRCHLGGLKMTSLWPVQNRKSPWLE